MPHICWSSAEVLWIAVGAMVLGMIVQLIWEKMK